MTNQCPRCVTGRGPRDPFGACPTCRERRAFHAKAAALVAGVLLTLTMLGWLLGTLAGEDTTAPTAKQSQAATDQRDRQE